jgi:hypothetical protein
VGWISAQSLIDNFPVRKHFAHLPRRLATLDTIYRCSKCIAVPAHEIFQAHHPLGLFPSGSRSA